MKKAMILKRVVLLLSLLGMGQVFVLTAAEAVEKKKVTVAITQFVSHGALDAVREGAVETLNVCAKDRFDITYDLTNASGNTLVASQIARKIASENPTVVLSISTLSTQGVLGAVRGKIPVVFGAITDPVAAQIGGPHVTGVTDKPPFKDQLVFVKEVLPSVKTLVVLYNPGEDNSRNSLDLLQKIGADLNISITGIGVSKASDIPQAVLKIAGTVDGIFIANDNLVASSFESLIKVANGKKIPVFASDIMLVDRGALGMRGIDYKQTGQEAGRQLCAILSGKSPKDIPVVNPQDLQLVLNEKAAKLLNIHFSKELLSKAYRVVREDAVKAS